jgi:ring-1,2-phenylacetyl-CoA epoxidase subunit PaaC
VSATLIQTSRLPVPAQYCLRLGDDALVMAQRLGEWLASAPQIEEDMALGNIALDLLGQARAFLTRAGELSGEAGGPAYTEDDLAYWRDERDYTNVQLVEQPRGDFALTITRLLVLSTWQVHLYRALRGSNDPVVAAISAKAVKEVDYHRDHARQWTLRLGLGTEVSHDRMVTALDTVAPYVAELFDDDPVTEAVAAQGIGVLPSTLRPAVEQELDAVLGEAGLGRPETTWRARGGRSGRHSTAMGHLLAEMQHLTRSHPGASW